MPRFHSLNFQFLFEHNPSCAKLGALAERYFADDPNTAIIKCRQFGEELAEEVAARVGVEDAVETAQLALLRELDRSGVMDPAIRELFHSIRILGNRAIHDLEGGHGDAIHTLKLARQLGIWFVRTFFDRRYRAVAFVAPRLDSPRVPEELAEEMERELVEARTGRAQVLAAIEVDENLEGIFDRARVASEEIELDETAARRLIDEQLRALGWEVDSEQWTHAAGARPREAADMAISNWPCEDGLADYVFFLGEQAVGVVEAKRELGDVAAAVQQAGRHARCLREGEEIPATGYRVPFLFASNGRPYQAAHHERSGIWFLDGRDPDAMPRFLMGWYSPEGLRELLG